MTRHMHSGSKRRGGRRRQGLWGVLCLLCSVSLGYSFLLPVRRRQQSSSIHTITTTRLSAATTAAPIKSGTPATKTLRDEIILLLTLPKDDGGWEQTMAMGQRLDFVLAQLEETFVPPQTLPFMNLLLEGTWINIYNSWAMSKKLKSLSPSPSVEMEEGEEFLVDPTATPESNDAVKLRSLTQQVTTNLTLGCVTSEVQWEYILPDDPNLRGAMIIRSQYEVNSRGIMEHTSSVEHDLRLDRAPKNPQVLIKGVQKVTPFDLFDPDATFVETAFIDHELRVTKTHSTRFGTIKNIFVRNGTELHAHLQECGVC